MVLSGQGILSGQDKSMKVKEQGRKERREEEKGDTLRVMFWNLENFFDNRNDSTSVSDAEFSSYGERHWSRKKFNTKCQAIAKGILWTAGEKGGLPDVIGVAEVENKRALQRLLYNTALHKLDYKIIHFESPDPRGIDVALLYRTSTLKRIRAKPCHLYGPDSTVLRTRDILLAEFERPGGTPVAFLVNHHPSKYGGASVSEARRAIAVGRLKQLADSLQAAGIEYIVAMGDFNDTPANPVYKRLEPTLRNLAEPLHRRGLGTIKYDGAGHAGRKPLRTFSGPRYIGGVSDHCPIWLDFH